MVQANDHDVASCWRHQAIIPAVSVGRAPAGAGAAFTVAGAGDAEADESSVLAVAAIVEEAGPSAAAVLGGAVLAGADGADAAGEAGGAAVPPDLLARAAARMSAVDILPRSAAFAEAGAGEL